ncbi:MAG: phosphotransferase, partial [Streptosporangiaceae bacterium]
LAGWDRIVGGRPDVGYEMPFYADHRDAGILARAGALAQPEIDEFQRELVAAVLVRLHEPAGEHESLSVHMTGAVRQAFDGLTGDPAFAALIEADTIELNGRAVRGPRAGFETIVRNTNMLEVIDTTPAVRLHGDLHLENILWRPLAANGTEPRLILIDLVSVAGVVWGLPLWDLVKYESYATGELMALRAEKIEVAGMGAGTGRYRCRIRTEDPALAPFRTQDWHSLFRRAFVEKHGPVNERAYRFIHGYFNAAMALNTSGLQRQGRLLRATEDFNAVLA